jgi:hypothetical protein
MRGLARRFFHEGHQKIAKKKKQGGAVGTHGHFLYFNRWPQ